MVPAQRSSYGTLQEKLLGLTFEPFANLSPPFRELSPAVFLHHASPCLYIFKHGFVDDPHMQIKSSTQSSLTANVVMTSCFLFTESMHGVERSGVSWGVRRPQTMCKEYDPHNPPSITANMLMTDAPFY